LQNGVNRINCLHPSSSHAHEQASRAQVHCTQVHQGFRFHQIRGARQGSSQTGKKAKHEKKPTPPAVIEHGKHRIKLVRDSFTMPRDEFERIARLKARAIDLKRPAKKSELLRAGLQVLERLDDASLLATLNALQPIKTGRPKKRH